MTQRQRMNAAREYSRNCRIRRLRKKLWILDTALLFLTLGLLWGLMLDRRQAAQEQTAEDVTAEAETVEPAAALIGAVPQVLPEEFRSQGWFTVTGYCACCTPYSHMNTNETGQVLTASGEWVEIGQCVAVDTDIIPLGSTVTIDGQAYTAYDTGVNGYVIDILMSHEDAQCAGARTEVVTWE